jgi:NADPH:quinone reductase-like Zn-dependent oxidoreductase
MKHRLITREGTYQMKAGVVFEVGKPPVYSEFKEPIPLDGEVCITVTASALTHFTKVRASGKHYSFPAQAPFIVGIDGVGRLDDGRRVYFLYPRSPFGGMAQKTVVRSSQCIPIPDGIDDVTLAAIADPGMSAWVALEARAKLALGETVLVNGATGSAGGMAVQIAKHLGARKVIATGRNQEALNALVALGADVVIPLVNESDALEAAFKEQFSQGVDIVLDYLWGPSAERLLAAAAKEGKGTVPLRFIQIGTASAPTITLPGTWLRSSATQIMGSGIGSVALEDITRVISKLIEAASTAGFQIATKATPLSRIGEVWSMESVTPRIVFTMSSLEMPAGNG